MVKKMLINSVKSFDSLLYLFGEIKTFANQLIQQLAIQWQQKRSKAH